MIVESKVKEELFTQYRKMIEQAAWQTARRYKMEIEETRAQGYLVFCEAIEKFDDSIGVKFGTYLFSRLRGIADFCKRNYSDDRELPDTRLIFDKDIATGLVQRTMVPDSQYECFKEAMEILETSVCLSSDAQVILNYLVGREWETPETLSAKVPRFHSVQLWFKEKNRWAKSRTAKAWEELKAWWQSGGQSTFNLGGSVW